MGRLFGTDGVRGIANDKLTCDLAFHIGQASAYVLTNEIHRPKILIGKDTRASGDMLESALIAGICSVGAETLCAGVVPTSAVAYLTRHYGADAGVVISASHNTVEYNGIKIFNGSGYKLADQLEERIEAIILDETETIPLPIGVNVGRRTTIKKAKSEYIDYLMSTIEGRLDGIKVVLDCANGAASKVAPVLMESLGAEVIALYNTPDGTNINDYCGSTHPQNLARQVSELGADLGLAFDGDADRLIAVDEHGKIVDGDIIMAICAIDMKNRGLLKKDTLVATVMSNLGLELSLEKHGIQVVKSDVGDRYVLERMLQDGYSLGGEQSGHIIFLDHNTTGDGILTGLQLMALLKRQNTKLSKLAKQVEILPQVLVNIKVDDAKKYDYKEDAQILEEIQKLEEKMQGKGRALIRASGTEPLVRVMLEGQDMQYIEDESIKIAKIIEEKFGVKG